MIEAAWSILKIVAHVAIAVAVISGIVGLLVQIAVYSFRFGAGI